MRRPPRRLLLPLALATVGLLATSAAATSRPTAPDAGRGSTTGTTGTTGTISTGQVAAGTPQLVVGRAAAPMGLLSGPDVSENNIAGKASVIRWGSVAGSGRSFAVVKATEGTRYTNPYFKRDWAGAKRAGIVRASYHFARPALPISTAADQARRFVATVGSITDGSSLPLVLDMEQSGGLRPAHLQQWTALFLSTVEKLSGRTPIVYTYTYFWQHNMGGSTAFTRYPLWIASYTSHPPHPLPGGWSHWTLWQFTDRGYVPGVRGGVDLSVFCCSPGALSQLANPTDAIGERYAALGGITGALGAPAGIEHPFGTNTAGSASGLFRDYAHGSIYWTKTDGAHVLTGATRARYRALGGPGSQLGWPQTDSIADEGGPAGATYAIFDGGRLYAGPYDPAAFLLPNGPILVSWLQRGSIHSQLGLPIADTSIVYGGSVGLFTSGQLLSSPLRGTHELHGAVLAMWIAAGGAASAYGLPSSDVFTVPGGEEALFGDLAIFAQLPPALATVPAGTPSADPSAPAPGATPSDPAATVPPSATATPSATVTAQS